MRRQRIVRGSCTQLPHTVRKKHAIPGTYLTALHRQHAHSAIAQRKSQALLWARDVSGIRRWMPSALLCPAALCMAVFTCQAHDP